MSDSLVVMVMGSNMLARYVIVLKLLLVEGLFHHLFLAPLLLSPARSRLTDLNSVSSKLSTRSFHKIKRQESLTAS